MQVLAIQTNGETVGLTAETYVVERLNTDRLLRDVFRYVKRGRRPLWNGKSEFTARPATDAEIALWQCRDCGGCAACSDAWYCRMTAPLIAIVLIVLVVAVAAVI